MTRMGSVEALARAVASVPELRLAVLFGSAAALLDRADSDLDVGVLSASDGPVDLPALRVRLERETGRIVDLISLDSAPPLLRMEIARHGRVLVERDPDAWSLFRAHAMIDWWDWAPTARLMHATAARRLREEAAGGASSHCCAPGDR
jgi:predicted nucleotidyltransferase